VLYTWDLYSITYGVPMEPAEENQLPIKTKKRKKQLTQQVYLSQMRRAYTSITSHHSILTLPEFKTSKDTHANYVVHPLNHILYANT